MTDQERLIAIKTWCSFMIKNQEQLKEEWRGPIMPDWNKGYLECLEDLRAILDDQKTEKQKISVPKDRFIFNFPAECRHYCTWCQTSMSSDDLFEHVHACVVNNED